MVDRVNGSPVQGIWVERDVRVVTVTAATGDFLDLADRVAGVQEGVNSSLEQALEVIASRATILGLTIENDTTFHVLLGYANAFTPGNSETDSGTVEAEIAAAIDAITAPDALDTVTVDTFDGFGGVAFGTLD